MEKRVEAGIAGRAIGVEPGLAPGPLHGPGWYADHGGIRRHRGNHHGIGADTGIIPHLDGTQNFRAGADNDIIADGGMALAMLAARAAESHLMVDIDIIAYLRRLTDDHAHAMVDDEAPAEFRAGVNFYTGEKTPDMRDEPARYDEAMT